MKNLKAILRISRYTSNKGPDGITISIQDQSSRLGVCELSLTLEQFAQAVTGLAVMDVLFESNLNDMRLGVEQHHETREILCPVSSYTDRSSLVQWLKENVVAAEGEEVSYYLGSQNSVSSRPDGILLRYSVRSWPVEATSSPG